MLGCLRNSRKPRCKWLVSGDLVRNSEFYVHCVLTAAGVQESRFRSICAVYTILSTMSIFLWTVNKPCSFERIFVLLIYMENMLLLLVFHLSIPADFESELYNHLRFEQKLDPNVHCLIRPQTASESIRIKRTKPKKIPIPEIQSFLARRQRRTQSEVGLAQASENSSINRSMEKGSRERGLSLASSLRSMISDRGEFDWKYQPPSSHLFFQTETADYGADAGNDDENPEWLTRVRPSVQHQSHLGECNSDNSVISTSRISGLSESYVRVSDKHVCVLEMRMCHLIECEFAQYCGWVSVLYIVGLLSIINESEAIRESGAQIGSIVQLTTNLLDLIRYSSFFAMISLIRLFFSSFGTQLEFFRTRHGILCRRQMKPTMRNVNENTGVFQTLFDRSKLQKNNEDNTALSQTLNNLRKNSSFVDSSHSVGLYLSEWKVSHTEFVLDLESLLKRYRVYSSRVFFTFILVYFVMNVLRFMVFIVSVVYNLIDAECNQKYFIESIDISHFTFELLAYFYGWIWLVTPLCENHKKLTQLERDLKSTSFSLDPQFRIDKLLVHDYLDSLLEHSPFTVLYLNPSYSRLFWLVQFLVLTLGYNLWLELKRRLHAHKQHSSPTLSPTAQVY